jgi:hypothetical protein
VAVQAGGVVYATTKVGSDGTWSVQIDALPTTVTSLNLSQRLTVQGVSLPISVPLSLSTSSLGVNLLN